MPLVIRRKSGESLVLRHADTGDLVRLAFDYARRWDGGRPTLHVVIEGKPGVFEVKLPEKEIEKAPQ